VAAAAGRGDENAAAAAGGGGVGGGGGAAGGGLTALAPVVRSALLQVLERERGREGSLAKHTRGGLRAQGQKEKEERK